MAQTASIGMVALALSTQVLSIRATAGIIRGNHAHGIKAAGSASSNPRNPTMPDVAKSLATKDRTKLALASLKTSQRNQRYSSRKHRQDNDAYQTGPALDALAEATATPIMTGTRSISTRLPVQ
eukprot:scaffold48_cov311-Pinguiococcus_pyrenoidosus.AAC.2